MWLSLNVIVMKMWMSRFFLLYLRVAIEAINWTSLLTSSSTNNQWLRIGLFKLEICCHHYYCTVTSTYIITNITTNAITNINTNRPFLSSQKASHVFRRIQPPTSLWIITHVLHIQLGVEMVVWLIDKQHPAAVKCYRCI